mmetsp:Transcript_11797/g.29476  ORF Transcript_11797/g.29476 Transcript_11797/m.29476 type:complete len:435 (-) Transcript_11797:400-1704(-)|eukprot:CAMPEP_0173425520 /NCGR_PEP_ID=MMETSP1357-20121228/5213_1 /TAXON_ID=77926 /ORGANISM="Hemiselmis rufescens, Strain PCC563" /LENGTH=434 /DNA_ID=CAMNT_0014388977 /DNA_START=290 /DNA_END=1594 /DNA_ORIENTATION=-
MGGDKVGMARLQVLCAFLVCTMLFLHFRAQPGSLVASVRHRTSVTQGHVADFAEEPETENISELKAQLAQLRQQLGTQSGGQPSVVSSSRQAAAENCSWRFSAYHSSEFEIEWSKDILSNQERVCERLMSEYKPQVTEYLSVQDKLAPNDVTMASVKCAYPDKHTFPPEELPRSVFSRFEYKWQCDQTPAVKVHDLGTVRTVYIEPIAGTLRHPSICTDISVYLVRKDYLRIDGWAIHNAAWLDADQGLLPGPLGERTRRRYFYFDIGASTWTTGAGSPSQEWFHAVYRDKCALFDQIFAWEAHKHDPNAIYKELPAEVKPRYHWYNIPANSEPGHSDNPLTILESVATPDDFVMLKLDIDNWRVEESFVAQILASTQLQARIDEMFWEHHVNFEPMRTKWGGFANVHRELKMKDSIDLFRQLRGKGIRAHSWV